MYIQKDLHFRWRDAVGSSDDVGLWDKDGAAAMTAAIGRASLQGDLPGVGVAGGQSAPPIIRLSVEPTPCHVELWPQWYFSAEKLKSEISFEFKPTNAHYLTILMKSLEEKHNWENIWWENFDQNITNNFPSNIL